MEVTTSTDFDLHLMGEGTDLRIYEKLGAHLMTVNGRSGVRFAVWAPNAEQVSVGLSTRIFNQQQGRDILQARAAQIFYAADREVSLDNVVENTSASDQIYELDFWPTRFSRFGARLLVDEETNDAIQQTYTYRYADNQFRAANFEYSFKEDSRDQASLSFAMPVNDRWSIQAKSHYSFRFDQVIENIIGLSYESCCWGIKILAQQEGDEDDNYAGNDTSVFFEITLKGLSQAGTDIDAALREAIPGYQAGF